MSCKPPGFQAATCRSAASAAPLLKNVWEPNLLYQKAHGKGMTNPSNKNRVLGKWLPWELDAECIVLKETGKTQVHFVLMYKYANIC